MNTVVSYPDRGKWGNNSYAGNCSGHLIKDLIEYFKPKRLFDPMTGSNTTGEVCKDLGINHITLDLNPKFGGFNALRDDVPMSSDLIFFHPPYADMHKYSGKQWGSAHPDDLSRAGSYQEFIKKLDRVQAKLITSLRKNGRLCVLVGDIKSKGKLMSIQRDMTWFGQPEQVVIKMQHNCRSDSNDYNGRFIPIVHEYLLIFKKDDCFVIPFKMTKNINIDIRNSQKVTWKDVVQAALEKLGGTANLTKIYQLISGHDKTANNENWQAKVRQVVGQCSEFVRLSRGKYQLATL